MKNPLKLTAAILVLANAAAAQSASDDELRGLTTNILAGIAGEKTAPVAPQDSGKNALAGLVQQALSEGQSDAYLEALVNEAVDKGEVEITDGMRTTTGDVDTTMLLASIVAKSEGATDIGETDVLRTEAGVAEEDRYYEVVSGDSLAGISLAFYGNTQDYTRIFEANRDKLRRADLISVGQSLLIPR